MTFTDVLSKIVLPTATAFTSAAGAYFTVVLALAGQTGAAVVCALLAVGFGYFVFRDVRKLLGK